MKREIIFRNHSSLADVPTIRCENRIKKEIDV